MTDHRRPSIPFTDAPRGTCRWCGEPILYTSGPRQGQLDRRRRWHPDCVDAYEASDPREARRQVRKRDKGRCAECGLDTYALRRSVRGPGRTGALRKLGFVPRRSLWELDHIEPLVDGGSHELSNLQTLCTPCHKQKTAKEARKRATQRKAEGSVSAPLQESEVSPASEEGRARDVADLDALLERAHQTNERTEKWLADWKGSERH